MEDLFKEVLHTPLYYKAHNSMARGVMSYKEANVVYELERTGYRLTLVAVGDREELRVGVSICNTKTDQFNKKLGVSKATMRALMNPTYLSKHEVMPSKNEVLAKLKEVHCEVGSNLKAYKKMLHGL